MKWYDFDAVDQSSSGASGPTFLLLLESGTTDHVLLESGAADRIRLESDPNP
jgi:hypothetical protein